MIIDTHSHIYVEEFDDDRDEAIMRAKENGVGHLFLPCIDESSLSRMDELCAKYPGYCSQMIGLHPTELGDDWKATLYNMYQLLSANPDKYIAVGEVGLDLYWDKSRQKEQEEVLRTQMEWALKFDKPLMIHCRDAWDELLTVFADYDKSTFRGVFHCFTGTPEEAKRLLEYPNFKLGIGGVVTFKKSTLPEALQHVPIDRIVLETDCPYLAPVPHRGKRNESAFLKHVLEKVSQVYDKPCEYVSCIINNSIRDLFGVQFFEM